MNNIFSNLWASNNSNCNLGDTQILKIGNSLQQTLNLVPEFKSKIITPKVVVVGSQSSGKSSVLNGLMSIDMLPTGSNMVTRTPLSINLIQYQKMFIEFGYYENNNWIVSKRIELTDPIPTNNEIQLIRDYIKDKTLELAGDQMGISESEINIKLYSPHVPNLNLIDLPGLTMVACTDKGQPKDIKIKIRELIKKYISCENAIIMGVFPARVDLEADIALDLIKEVDSDFNRTIGALTKIDLMNKDTDVISYITNTISNDLKLKYGYFAIKNRSNTETKQFTIYDGFTREMEYFNNHCKYSVYKDTKKFGINNLGRKLSDILVKRIKIVLPEIHTKIIDLLDNLDSRLQLLGSPIPDDSACRISFLNTIANDFCTNYRESLNNRCCKINSGRLIKDYFIEFRQNIGTLDPFNSNDYSDSKIIDIIKNCEGNHMSFPLPPIEFIEICISNMETNPFNDIINLSTKCVGLVSSTLKDLSNKLLSKEEITRFSNIKSNLNDVMSKNIDKYHKYSISRIQEIIKMEQNYIWTDEPEFLNNLKTIFNKNTDLNHENFRKILSNYFNHIKKILQHIIPKSIMLFLVYNVENNMRSILFDLIQQKEFYNSIKEENSVEKKRNNLKLYKSNLENSKKLLESI